MRHSATTRLIGAVFFILLACTFVLAQTTAGTITGTVSDPSGAVVPATKITLTNLATNVERTTISNTDGIYVFANVPPGSYRVDAEKGGFKHYSRSPIDVQVQQGYRINVTLELGAVTQQVNVTGATPLLQPTSSSLGQVIAGRSVSEMPLNGRNVFNLMALVPSVVPQGQSQGTPTGANPFAWNNYSINGSFGNTGAVFLDGVPLGSGYINLPSFIPTQDSIQEFKVQTSNLGPEWGRFAGGAMNLTTKSGTNHIHGEAYEYLRNKVLNANDFFSNEAGIPTPAFTQNQFGANAGGPLVIPGVYNGKDKTFWFFSYEGFRLRQGETFVTTVPTAAERTGDFSNLRDSSGNLIPVYDPLTVCGELGNAPCPVDSTGQPIYTRQQFQGNIIPQSMLNPTSVDLISLWPLPNVAGSQYTNNNNYTAHASVGGNNDEEVTRIDENISQKQHMFGRYSHWSNLNLPIDPLGTGICVDRCQESFSVNDAVLDDTYTFNPTLLMDIHAGFDRFVYLRTPINQNFDLTSIGWPSILNSQIPGFLRTPPTPDVSGMASEIFGTQGQSGISAFTNDWYFSGDITKVAGRHTLKAGAQLMILQDNYAQTNIASGLFNFNSGFTASSPFGGAGGFGWASYLLGYSSGGNNHLPALTAGQERYRAFYFGDTWQATKKLTLDYGVRYDQQGPWTERFNRESLWNFGVTNALIQNTSLPAKGELCLVASSCRKSRSYYNLDWTQFAPRIGFAYSLDQDTVIRGGYGIFWIPVDTSWVSPNTDPVNGVSTPFVSSINGGITPFNNFGNPFPTGVLEPPGRTPDLNSIFLGQGVTTMYPDARYPYMQQWNFDIQRQLPAGFFVDAAYAGSKGTHLAPGGRTLNQLPDQYLSMGTALLTEVSNPYYGLVTKGSLAQPTVAAGQLLRPFPQYTGVGIPLSGYGNSNYNSFQLKVQRKFSKGGTLLAAYTVAKLLGNVDTKSGWLESTTGGVGGVQDWNNLRNEYSISSQDVPQRLVVSYVVDLPVGHGQKLLSGTTGVADKLVSGWGLDGITTFQSGFPLKLSTSQNLTNSFGGGSRPNVVPGCSQKVSGSAESRLNNWFNTACFAQPAAFTFGDEPRVDPHLRMEGEDNFDLSLFKNTNFGPSEKLGVQFRAEFFNLFNRPQFGPPGTTVGTSQFGVVSSQVNNARLVQFALKFLF